MSTIRTPYPSDVSDEEWAFVAPYLALLPEDVSQRKHELREVFNGLCYLVNTGVHWCMLPHDPPPWPVVYQQMRRCLVAECFEAIVHDLRGRLRRATKRQTQPSAAILDSRRCSRRPRAGRAPVTMAQAPEGLEGTRGHRYAWPLAGAGRVRRRRRALRAAGMPHTGLAKPRYYR